MTPENINNLIDALKIVAMLYGFVLVFLVGNSRWRDVRLAEEMTKRASFVDEPEDEPEPEPLTEESAPVAWYSETTTTYPTPAQEPKKVEERDPEDNILPFPPKTRH